MSIPDERGLRLARLMDAAVFMLEAAVDDVAAGRYTEGELGTIADGLDRLSDELRRPRLVVVEGER